MNIKSRVRGFITTIHTQFSLSPEKGSEQGAQGRLPSMFTLQGFFLQTVGREESEFSSHVICLFDYPWLTLCQMVNE